MNEDNDLKKLYNSAPKEYFDIVDKILKHKEFKKRLKYHHHEHRSVFVHSLMVSIKSYKLAKKLKADYKSAAIGGLLHDFYYNDWQTTSPTKPGIKNMHGFAHAKEALENSQIHFPDLIDEKISNIIVRHMFPLNIIPPKYIESWIVTFVDKYVSFEVFKTPGQLYKYLGLGKPGEKNE